MSDMHIHDAHSPNQIDRRHFLRLGGAALALAGLDGCARMPAEHILPYVDNRPELTPGVGQYYATAMSIDGFATGLVVESHNGRPTKIEGNPQHPASLGATSAIHQASVLQLYDPDRAKAGRIGAARATWGTIADQLAPPNLRRRVGTRGERLRLLIEPTSSVLEEELLGRLLAVYPDAQIHMYAPLMPTTAVVPRYDFTSVDVIVAVESDFLASGPMHLVYAKQFADRRRLASPNDAMNRLYAIESSVSSTGGAADHRFAVRPRDMAMALQSLARGVRGEATTNPSWVGTVARDLSQHRGRAVVVAGDGLAAELRAIIDEINAAIGASGSAAWYAPSPLIGRTVPVHSLDELATALRAKAVDTVIVVGGNPSYATPGAMQFRELLRSVPNTGYIGLYENETARDARWFVPMSHYLESWGDARSYDGTVSIVQPLVNPLYDSIVPSELYATLAGNPLSPAGAYSLLRASFAARTAGDVEMTWASAVQRGIVDGTATSERAAAPVGSMHMAPVPASDDGSIDLIFIADPKVHDGTHANNAWLQELPASITQLTWGNAALLSPRTAQRLGVTTGEALTLRAGNEQMAIPALVLPGHADDAATVHFGYGRAGAESLARGVGANAYVLWPDTAASVRYGVHATVGGAAPEFALAQTESTMAIGNPVRHASLAEYRQSPASIGDRPGRVLSLYPEPSAPGETPSKQWAMTIDLSTCVGCGACVVACQAENNTPVVGADQVRNHRQMQWLRIDRYFAEPGGPGEPQVLLQPMLCQHCEHAPCEYVCPVGATVHSNDGLNEMVYNRCVGTRFCSNNCPYKVRRFNWYDYNAHLSETELMVKNPNVSVRERGVMEKCTFCVQRIREAEIAAQREGHPLRGTTVQTACQQACPTNAIVFGSLDEGDSEMVRRRLQPRAYAALGDLGTEPRVRYLARIRNANPELEPKT